MLTLSRRALLQAAAATVAATLLQWPTVTASTEPKARFNWNRRVLRAEQRNETIRATYYKRHQLDRYQPYIQTASM